MLLRFVKKYAEFLSVGGFCAYWIWDAKLSAYWNVTFSTYDAKDWMSMANTLASLTVSIVALYGINSWKKEYKNKKKAEVAIEFAEHALNAIDSFKHITSILTLPQDTSEDSENSIDPFSAGIIHKINSCHSTFNKLFAIRNRSQITLGQEADNIIKDIKLLLFDIEQQCRKHYAIAKNIHEIEKGIRVLCATPEPNVRHTTPQKLVLSLQDEQRAISKKLYHDEESEMGIMLSTLEERINRIVSKNTF
ncbi:hypothetical protein [Halodesulfovibrio marinisediminis]|uniref:Uncharacterized protein n=1 Tax=Halodesulfovibrio marinisediminis DSM 17456 TaxID=1121457 RepID=A0A1N6DQI1_9BACT|nr:hypothetical protein [Halodesulfovibrio marinisediminis]SIN73055.1 hypothetical protein SAMN02745161_0395 [Halodesulfovibrio marinisediminis DSM 17456]